MKHALAALAGLALLLPLQSWPADSLPRLELSAFVTAVEEANPWLQAAAARAEALRYRVEPARTPDDPVFAFGPDAIPFGGGGTMFRYELSQTLPFPGSLRARGDAAEARARSAAADVETTRRQLRVAATQAFWRAVYNQEAIRLNQEARLLLQPIVEVSRVRYETGSQAHHDWLLSRSQLAVLETRSRQLERERTVLKATLNEMRNLPPDYPLGDYAIPDTIIRTVLPGAADPELQPELRALEFSAEAARRDAQRARLGYFPELMIQGMVMDANGMEEPSTWGVMLGINLPIFAHRRQANQVRAAEREAEMALREQHSIRNRLATELVEAREQARTAADLVQLYEQSVLPETRLALDSVRDGYLTGSAPLSSVLNLLLVRLTQELEYLAARSDLAMAVLRGEEPLSSPPIQRLAPPAPTLFFADPVGGGMDMPASPAMPAGMGSGGMRGPGQRPGATAPADPAGMGGM